MNEADTLNERLQRHIDFIDEAVAQIRNGALPNLKPLDDAMRLCTTVQKAKPAIAKELQPRMAEMIGRLDQLAMEIEAYRKELKAR